MVIDWPSNASTPTPDRERGVEGGCHPEQSEAAAERDAADDDDGVGGEHRPAERAPPEVERFDAVGAEHQERRDQRHVGWVEDVPALVADVVLGEHPGRGDAGEVVPPVERPPVVGLHAGDAEDQGRAGRRLEGARRPRQHGLRAIGARHVEHAAGERAATATCGIDRRKSSHTMPIVMIVKVVIARWMRGSRSLGRTTGTSRPPRRTVRGCGASDAARLSVYRDCHRTPFGEQSVAGSYTMPRSPAQSNRCVTVPGRVEPQRVNSARTCRHPPVSVPGAGRRSRVRSTSRAAWSGPSVSGRTLVTGCRQTWSAPAARCSSMRATIAASSPHATTASTSASDPSPSRSVGGEAQPLEVAHVVGRAEVEAAGVLPGEPARLVGIGFEHDRQLGREQLAVAEDLAGAARVLDRHEVRVGAVGGVASELEHPRAQRGEHDRRRLRRLGRGVRDGRHLRQVVARRRERRPVVDAAHLDRGRMADAQPGDETARERLADGADRRAVLSGSRPQMLAMPVAITSELGRGQQRRRPRERLLAARRLAEPERGVPEPLELAQRWRGRRRPGIRSRRATHRPAREACEKSYMKSCAVPGSRADCGRARRSARRRGGRCDEVRASRVQRSAAQA